MLGVAAALTIGAVEVQAQAIGPQVSWGNDSDLGVGARIELGLPNLLTSSGPLASTFLIGSFDYFFIDCDECTYWELNGNLAVPIAASSVDPYVGAGLNVSRFSIDFESDLPGFDVDGSSTDIGLNLLGGLRFPVGGLNAFGEGRFTVGGGEQLVLSFGVLFGGR